MVTNGYLYCAWGTYYTKLAAASVRSLRKADPTAHVTLVTRTDTKELRADEELWDRLVIKPDIRSGLAGKVDCLSNEYYENTLYLDSDTYICEDPSELFDLLGYFDLCVVGGCGAVDTTMLGLTPYNTGVTLLGPGTTELLKTFRAYYNDEEKRMETNKTHRRPRCNPTEPSFTLAIRDTDVRVHVLSNEWNALYRFDNCFSYDVKIIHGPPTDFEAMRERMNYRDGQRIWRSTKRKNT